MPDEAQQTTDETQIDETEAALDENGAVAQPKDDSPAARAQRGLRRARKALGPDFDEDPTEARYWLQQAEVFALLDIADALRSRED